MLVAGPWARRMLVRPRENGGEVGADNGSGGQVPPWRGSCRKLTMQELSMGGDETGDLVERRIDGWVERG